jgi:hypothetical protein
MKKIFKSLISLMLGLVAFSCNESPSSEFDETDQLQTYLVKVGQDHNNGLEFIFNQLSNEKSTLQNFDQLVNSIERNSNLFLKNETQDFVRTNYENAKKYSTLSLQDIRARKSRNARVNESENLWKDSDEVKLTTTQKKLLSELNSAINDESLGLTETLQAFERIRVRAKSECSDKEIFTVLAAIEVGTNSLTYWHSNIDKWSNLVASLESKSANGRISYNKRTQSDFSWKSVGKADVSGAIGAAVGVGVAAIVTGPPGWAAGGAAVAGGAVGASAGDAVLQLLDSWWGD